MVFTADGSVTLGDGKIMFVPQGLAADSRIVYSPSAPLGMRYTVEIPTGKDPRSYERHPVVHVSWFGALKFCNWLTLKRGMPATERCYTEGSNAGDWHPVTISDADWATRDLNDTERLAMQSYTGLRLPMDNQDTQTGWIGSQVGSFNEWYKAAAYDPLAPDFDRLGPGSETVPSDHWIYGYGRDTIGVNDANYSFSVDPFSEDDAFVGLYDGTTHNPGGSGDIGNGNQFTTNDTDNPYEMYDLSGNVAELGQDKGPTSSSRARRGGSHLTGSDTTAATYRDVTDAATTDAANGFRIFQTHCPWDLDGDGFVTTTDFFDLIGKWGPFTGPPDFDGDGMVTTVDFFELIANWGPCP
jgi:hypothetical protein